MFTSLWIHNILQQHLFNKAFIVGSAFHAVELSPSDLPHPLNRCLIRSVETRPGLAHGRFTQRFGHLFIVAWNAPDSQQNGKNIILVGVLVGINPPLSPHMPSLQNIKIL